VVAGGHVADLSMVAYLELLGGDGWGVMSNSISLMPVAIYRERELRGSRRIRGRPSGIKHGPGQSGRAASVTTASRPITLDLRTAPNCAAGSIQ
jgi:hypothetical protein